MDHVRLIVAIVLSTLVFILWHVFFGGSALVRKTPQKVEKAAVQKEEVKPSITAAAPIAEKQPEKASVEPSQTGPAREIRVETPLYIMTISEKGATVTSFVLKDYRETVEKNSPLKELVLQGQNGGDYQLDFAGKSVAGLEDAVFTASAAADALSVTGSSQTVSFSWRSSDGVVIQKSYRFDPKSYLIDMEVRVQNDSQRSFEDQLVVSMWSSVPKAQRYGFAGPSAMIGKSVEQYKIKSLKEKNRFSGEVKWVALQSRYFVASLIPATGQNADLRMLVEPEDIVEAQYIEPRSTFSAGSSQESRFELFLGPKSMKVLDEVGHDLAKVVDFGMFSFIAKPCVWLMNFIYSFIPNYGIAIIIITVLVKVLLWPLGTKSYKSMHEMKKLQPLMQEIREKYKHDKKKMNEEVMGLYRTYKINPLGGCLPMVVQIPVFFALYRMLYESIELRHAPFLLWIRDLSAPDRLFHFDFSIPFMEPPYGIPVLTIIMGATMLLQQKMSPPMGDPTQAKMMMLMPLVFTFIFINFPSGLVLYWLVNNILSIAQQYYITKKLG
jgi:YidC/Oxa1 family membrane protein insertase